LFEIFDVSTNQISHVISVSVSDDAGQGDFMIVATSQSENDEGLWNLRLRTSFVDYPVASDPTMPASTATFSL